MTACSVSLTRSTIMSCHFELRIKSIDEKKKKLTSSSEKKVSSIVITHDCQLKFVLSHECVYKRLLINSPFHTTRYIRRFIIRDDVRGHTFSVVAWQCLFVKIQKQRYSSNPLHLTLNFYTYIHTHMSDQEIL